MCSQDKELFFTKHNSYYPAIEAVKKNNPNVEILKLSEYFCSENACAMAKDGILFFRDNSHLNINGSEYVSKRILTDHPLLAE
jgi:hypothetical protein